MKHFSKILALCLAAVMFFAGCGSNSAYDTQVAATYGDKSIMLDEANFWLRYYQMSYSSYYSFYTYYYGYTDIWTQVPGQRTQNLGETLKENTMAEVLQAFILSDHAKDYDVSLSEAELSKISTFADDVMKDETMSALVKDSALTKEKVVNWVTARCQAIKVYEGVKAQAPNVSVSDADADSFSLNYFIVSSSSSAKESAFNKDAVKDDKDLSGEELANRIKAELEGGKEFSQLKTALSSLTANTLSYRHADTENASILYKQGKDLKDDDVIVYKNDSTWYVIQCVSAHDEHATEHAREDLEDEQRDAYFNTVYADWAKAAAKFSVKKCYNDLVLKSGN